MLKIRFIAVATLALLIALSIPGLSFAGNPEKINLNAASVEQLVELNGIGPSYAQKIIEHRESVGPFKSTEDIMKVKGIGLKTYENNKDIMVVE